MMSDLNGWHLDKRVPITLVIVIGLQTSAAIWWASSMDARLTAAEITLASRAPLFDQFLQVATRQEGVMDRLKVMEVKLDRALELLNRRAEIELRGLQP